MISPRKQSLLDELGRAPADRRSRIGLRRSFLAAIRQQAPSAPRAAGRIQESGHG